MVRTIAVYLGSSNGHDPSFVALAEELGLEISKRRISLVFGGSSSGCMGAIARTVREGGGNVVGVVPRLGLVAEEWNPNDCVSKLIVVDSMHERKTVMFEKSDCIIALPGGVGTWEEILEVYCWAKNGFHKKPVAILNWNGYYDGLVDLIKQSVKSGFMTSEDEKILIVANSIPDLLKKLDL